MKNCNPCTCGYSYKDWTIQALYSQIEMLQDIVAIKERGTFLLKCECGWEMRISKMMEIDKILCGKCNTELK